MNFAMQIINLYDFPDSRQSENIIIIKIKTINNTMLYTNNKNEGYPMYVAIKQIIPLTDSYMILRYITAEILHGMP